MIRNKKIAVIGLGYVGLPFGVEFEKYYFETTKHSMIKSLHWFDDGHIEERISKILN